MKFPDSNVSENKRKRGQPNDLFLHGNTEHRQSHVFFGFLDDLTSSSIEVE